MDSARQLSDQNHAAAAEHKSITAVAPGRIDVPAGLRWRIVNGAVRRFRVIAGQLRIVGVIYQFVRSNSQSVTPRNGRGRIAPLSHRIANPSSTTLSSSSHAHPRDSHRHDAFISPQLSATSRRSVHSREYITGMAALGCGLNGSTQHPLEPWHLGLRARRFCRRVVRAGKG